MGNRDIVKTLNLVEKLEENEEYEKAIEELLKIHSISPNNIEIIKNLAMNYQVLNDNENAIIWWENYKKLEPNELISYFQLTDLYIDSDKHKYYLNRAQIKVIEQKLTQAVDDFKKSIANAQSEEDATNVRFLLAVVYEALNKQTDAINEYLRILEHEKSSSIYYRLAELYKSESDEDAINLLEQAILDFPDEVPMKEMLAKLYYKSGNLESALKYAQDDLTKVKVYLEKQDNVQAMEILNTCKITKDNAIQYHSLMAEYHYNNEKFDKAFESLDELEKINPNYPLLYQMRALIFEAKNSELDAHLCWAKCYELKGEVELSIDELLLAHNSNPKNEKVIMMLINIYDRQNDYNSVIEFCEKLYKIDENNTFAIKKLAEFYNSHGEFDVAVDFYEKLYVADKSNMNNLKALAEVYEKIKDVESAKKAWEKYLQRAPIGEETEKIKQKLANMNSNDYMGESSQGFLDKILGFFTKK